MKCFIGLPAAPSVINKLVDAQDRALSFDAGARPVPKENFHLTLAFIGEIEPDKSWLIDNSGLFIRPQVAWVGGSASPEIEHLARESREILDRLHISYDKGRFKPHITILRKSHLAEPVIQHPFEWPILRPRIFESRLNSDGRREYVPL